MARGKLISRLNQYYEELSTLNKELEKYLKDPESPMEKISDLLTRKDYCINQCIKIKEILEKNPEDVNLNEATTFLLNGEDASSDETKPKSTDSGEPKENIELLESMLQQEKMNQELVKKNLFKIKEELKKAQSSKNKVKSYQQSSKKSGSFNKKA